MTNDLDPADRAMLNEALTRAGELVAELENQQKELDASPVAIDAATLTDGRHAMIKVIGSARRMLAALDDAEQMANSVQT